MFVRAEGAVHNGGIEGRKVNLLRNCPYFVGFLTYDNLLIPVNYSCPYNKVAAFLVSWAGICQMHFNYASAYVPLNAIEQEHAATMIFSSRPKFVYSRHN